MTRTEQDLIQSLRMEMQTSFTEMRDAITDLTAEQRAHAAVHMERENRAVASTITRRWVWGVVLKSIAIIATVASIATTVVIKLLAV